ncbi:MAG: hypothetical protein ACM3JJ_01820 [Hyphomicrobiales bacterium]
MLGDRRLLPELTRGAAAMEPASRARAVVRVHTRPAAPTRPRAALRAGLLLLGALAVSCAPRSGTDGWGAGDPYQRHWNGRVVETVSGTVASVDRIRPARGMAIGAGLHLRTERLVLVVHLGPEAYVERQPIRLAPGDRVKVRGALVTIDGQLLMIAQRATRGGDVLRLRDGDGRPLWDAAAAGRDGDSAR